MWLLTHSRLFDIYFYDKVLFFVWIFTQCNPARGDPDTATVTKARCYANCLTENPATNETGIPCQTSACKECLGPCGWSYPDEARCKETCKTSSCCQDSCEFLTKVKTLSSIITGDGSLPPNPRNLTVTNRSFTSISLQWEAVKNTNGSPVYLIEMELSRGKAKYFPLYMEEVFVVPQATISLPNLCSNIAEGRFLFNLLRPLSLKFKVAVLTENSSLSTGEQTVQTTFVKPEPVKNVTVERIEYEPSSFFTFGQLKATISLITPKVLDYKHPITSHYLEWRNDPMACYSGGFMDAILRPNQTTCSLYMRLYNIRCSQFFVKIHVSSVIGCSISDPVTLTYTFPGCQNITNFPKRECVRLTGKILLVPIKDGVVRNIRASIPLTSKDDYPFYNVTINWDPPAYHFSPVVLYRVTLLTYKRCSGKPFLHYAGFHVEATPYTTFFHLLPNTTYHTVVRAMFIRWQSFLNGRSIIFTTPDINRTELYVRFKGNQLNPSPKGNSFDVNISWDEPIFNRRLTGYQFSYQVGNRKMVVNETKKTHFIIPEVMHGEQFTYRVTPKYNYTWLEGEEQLGKATVEVPPDDDVEVRNIEVGEFALEKGNSTFSVKFSWTGPVFNFTLYGYHFNYELTGYKEHAIMFKGNVFSLDYSSNRHG